MHLHTNKQKKDKSVGRYHGKSKFLGCLLSEVKEKWRGMVGAAKKEFSSPAVPAVPVSVLDTPSLGFTMQEISGAEAGERNVSVPAEIALPPTCPAQLLLMAILPSRPPHYPAPSKIANLLCQKEGYSK